jgi:hypothetical protein
MQSVRFEPYQDLSLRILTAIVFVTILGCAAFLAWRSWRGPPPVLADPVPVSLAESLPVRGPEPALTRTLPALEILMSPDTVFRCQQQGRVVYSDQACPKGQERVITVAAPALREAAPRQATSMR